MRRKGIFDFLKSRDARLPCPLCGHERWNGWDERVLLMRMSAGFAAGVIEDVRGLEVARFVRSACSAL